MLSLIMERIRVVSDSPGYIKVREISKELRSFTKIIEDKYNQIDFDFAEFMYLRNLKNEE